MEEAPAEWEYYTEFVVADASKQAAFVQQFYPQGKMPSRAVQATLPRLNELGAAGWELVQLQPVSGVGSNGDILMLGVGKLYTSLYLAVFKKRKG